VTRVYVEPTGESRALAAAELHAAAEALDGVDTEALPGLLAVDLPDRAAAELLARRLALGRRCLVEVDGPSMIEAAERRGADHAGASVRRLGRPSGGRTDATVLEVGNAYVRGGGSIDLDQPARRLWIGEDTAGRERLLEEVATTSRPTLMRRRISLLPFQRPIGLDPRLARAAANLARIRLGDRVLDPFLGTGALLAEAGLLGARLYGIDRDPAMVRGALQNLAFLGLSAEEVIEGDAGSVSFADRSLRFDALLTDPPYGRASGTGGEDASALVGRVIPRWADRVRPGGRLVVVSPGGEDAVGRPWHRELSVPVRVHRSLTREFRVYAR